MSPSTAKPAKRRLSVVYYTDDSARRVVTIPMGRIRLGLTVVALSFGWTCWSGVVAFRDALGVAGSQPVAASVASVPPPASLPAVAVAPVPVVAEVAKPEEPTPEPVVVAAANASAPVPSAALPDEVQAPAPASAESPSLPLQVIEASLLLDKGGLLLEFTIVNEAGRQRIDGRFDAVADLRNAAGEGVRVGSFETTLGGDAANGQRRFSLKNQVKKRMKLDLPESFTGELTDFTVKLTAVDGAAVIVPLPLATPVKVETSSATTTVLGRW